MITLVELDDNLITANSISIINDRRAKVVIANLTNSDIKLPIHKRVANFEQLDRELASIRSIQPLGQTDETAGIGDELSKHQIKQLNELLEKYIDAFSVRGEIGCTDLAEHKIELSESLRRTFKEETTSIRRGDPETGQSDARRQYHRGKQLSVC